MFVCKSTTFFSDQTLLLASMNSIDMKCQWFNHPHKRRITHQLPVWDDVLFDAHNKWKTRRKYPNGRSATIVFFNEILLGWKQSFRGSKKKNCNQNEQKCILGRYILMFKKMPLIFSRTFRTGPLTQNSIRAFDVIFEIIELSLLDILIKKVFFLSDPKEEGGHLCTFALTPSVN